MSEHIQITIAVSESVKKNMTHHTDETLMSTLLKNNLISENFCGGTGKCGRCRVQFLQAAPLPGSAERAAFSPDELRQGYRLACMARPKNNCVIRLDFPNSQKIDIITDMIEMSGDIDRKSQRSESPSMVNHGNAGSMIAVDLGTTTIAMQLMDVETGAVIDTYCALNPQRSYGADVLSRIRAAGMGHAEELRSSVWKVLQDGVDRFRNDSIRCMCIAGNTTMEHLLMGFPTESLGKSPFTPVEIGLQQCTMPEGSAVTSETLTFPVYVTPGISTFVGGDIVAGLYHCRLFPRAMSQAAAKQTFGECREDGVVLFIDLGTNGEMAITDGKRMIVTATAAGPAFEGGAGVSVQGSDMIALTASLLAKGIIDETGLLAEPYFEKGITIPLPGRTEQIHLTQKDIRDLQMAKAAVRAGVEILCEKMDFPKIAKVYLAGGFGYYLDVEAAVKIGLLPESVREVTHAAGNTSLAGAFKIGRDLVTHQVSKESLEQKLCRIESINLAEQENFESLYLGYLNFPI